MIFYIDLGETSPAIEAACVDQDGHLVHLGGATATFSLFQLGGAEIFTRAATIVDAPAGHVRYQWLPGDTNAAGTLLGRFTVSFPSATVVNFPSDRYISVEIQQN